MRSVAAASQDHQRRVVNQFILFQANLKMQVACPMLSGPERLTVGAMDDDASEERITQMAHNSHSAELECTHEPVARPEISETRPPRAWQGKGSTAATARGGADRGVLCSVEWKRHRSKIAIPIKPSEGKARTPHICENDLGWFDMRDLGAVLDHEEPLSHPASDQAQ